MLRNRKLALLLAVLLTVALTGCASKKSGETKSPAQAPAKESQPRYEVPTQPSTAAPTPPTQNAGQGPADMYYRNYPVNPPTNTKLDSVSTFSVDVDTASFTLARNYLERGQLPPPEAIRAEEFINYFPQTYAASDEPVAIHVEGAPSPFRPGLHLVQVGLKARDLGRAERKPAVLTFVIDVSGSMNMENRLGLVKRTLGILVDQMRPDDQIGIVIYGTRGRTLLEHTSDKALIRQTIDRLQPEGSTNAEEGLRLAYDLAYRGFRKNAINRIILCSDGVANVGVTGPEGILQQVEDYRTRGITLTTVGFGMGNYNDALMEQLADKGDGQYAYVDDLDEARRIFVEQLNATLQIVAKDTKVQVSFNPDQVASWRLVGYENRALNDSDFRNDRTDAGEMGAGQTVTALYEVQLRGTASTLGSVTIRYKDPTTAEAIENVQPIERRALTSVGHGSASLRWTAAVAEFAGLLRGSPWAAESRLADVISVARGAAGDLDLLPAHREALEMMQKAYNLRTGR